MLPDHARHIPHLHHHGQRSTHRCCGACLSGTTVGPNPRYRLYTRPRSYAWLLQDWLSRRMESEETVVSLERALSDWVGGRQVVAMPMCRVGLYFAIKALACAGTEVILSPYTIADVVNMVIAAGARPVFADIDVNTCNIDPVEVGRLVGPKTGAVLITHLHGLAAPATEIHALCQGHGIPVIEDAAQAFGTRIGPARAGCIGEAGVYSFGTYKNINGWYGGALVTADAAIADRLRSEVAALPYQSVAFLAKRMAKGLMTDLVTAPPIFQWLTYRFFRHGHLHEIRAINRRVETELNLERRDAMPEHYLRRPTGFQARLVASQINQVDVHTATRVENAVLYAALLQDAPGLGLPPLRQDGSHIYTYYPVRHPQRRALLRFLMLKRRDVAAQHLKNCADLPAFAEFARDCPNARALADQVVLLPTYPRYGELDIRLTAAAVRDFCIQTHRA